MHILADENIPGLSLFTDIATVQQMPGRHMCAADLQNVDILLVRSVTRVDQALLENSSVRFVGTATIGTDHLDIDYLQAAGIAWAAAPGSNAEAVADYVLSALVALDSLPRLADSGRVGIVGFGNVGSRVYSRLSALGMNCIAYDPLLPAAQYPMLRPLSELMRCELICLHTPLTSSGAYPTLQLFDRQRLQALPVGTVLLNAGRGAVVDNDALLELADSQQLQLVMDVWQTEPAVAPALIAACRLATPHIAGYSSDGKWRATVMLRQQLDQWLGQTAAATGAVDHAEITVVERGDRWADLGAAIQSVYDVRRDDRDFRAACGQQCDPQAFDRLRKQYWQRRELQTTRVSNAAELSPALQQLLRASGFAGV